MKGFRRVVSNETYRFGDPGLASPWKIEGINLHSTPNQSFLKFPEGHYQILDEETAQS